MTREEHHQDVLEVISREGRPDGSHLFASLGVCPAASGKHAGTSVVEVRLNGQRVGELTRGMSDRYMATVTSVLASDSIPACLASLDATRKGWQVELLLPRVE